MTNQACHACGAMLGDGSAYCYKCGARQAPAAAPAAAASAEPEQLLWAGRPSARAFAHYFIGSLLFAALMLYVGYNYTNIATGAAIAAALPLVYSLLVVALAKLATRYRLTTQRIFIDRGILNRKITETELIRIDDVAVAQNILQRVFNVGVVSLAAADKDQAIITLLGIDRPIEVKELIRAQVRKQQARVIRTQAV